MTARIFGATLDGLETIPVTLEASSSAALRAFDVRVVGLPDLAVREGVQRARSAVWPIVGRKAETMGQGILINLAPADRRKAGRSLDLPLAMAYVAVLLGLPDPSERGLCFFGELGLGGDVRAVPGVLTVALRCAATRSGLVIPADNLAEAALANGPPLYPVRRVEEALEVLRGKVRPWDGPRGLPPTDSRGEGVDLAEVSGQFQARRALEVAAAGGHNLVLEGPPGSGKTMLARRMTSILPPLDDGELLETAEISSVVGRLDPARLRRPPFRAPHHTATPAGLAGGGAPLRPGEFTLAHRGVLFLDEFPEFDRRALEVLREPLEEGLVHLTRAGAVRTFPCRFLCIAAMNPCPCGYHGLGDGRCRCPPPRVAAYRARVSGPLWDRFDLRVFLRPVPAQALFEAPLAAEPSRVVRERVVAARERQHRRYGGHLTNGSVSESLGRAAAGYGAAERRLLVELVQRDRLSARGARRLERVARTLADLADADGVRGEHLLEAAAFRIPALPSAS